MNKKQNQSNEEEFIHFLIDPDAVSEDEKNQIKAQYNDEIKDWQELVGKPPVLQEARWHRIKAAFWQQADSPDRRLRILSTSLAGVTSIILLFFLLSPGNQHPGIKPARMEATVVVQNCDTLESFESLADMLMPVAPVTESIWFQGEGQEDQNDDTWENLILITNNLTGEIS